MIALNIFIHRSNKEIILLIRSYIVIFVLIWLTIWDSSHSSCDSFTVPNFIVIFQHYLCFDHRNVLCFRRIKSYRAISNCDTWSVDLILSAMFIKIINALPTQWKAIIRATNSTNCIRHFSFKSESLKCIILVNIDFLWAYKLVNFLKHIRV